MNICIPALHLVILNLHCFTFIKTRQTGANCGGIICVLCYFSQITSFPSGKQNFFHLTLSLAKQYILHFHFQMWTRDVIQPVLLHTQRLLKIRTCATYTGGHFSYYSFKTHYCNHGIIEQLGLKGSLKTYNSTCPSMARDISH